MELKRGAGIWVLLFVLLACFLAGCAGRGGAEGKEAGTSEAGTEEEDKRVPVEVATLERGAIEAVLRYATNLEAEKEVEVFSQAARQVTALLVEEGDRVSKGQVLLRLQDDEQRSNLALMTSQRDKAKREYERQQRLHEQDLISEQAFNDATYELEQLELQVADAQRELTYTEVRAPIRGTITRRLVNLGDQITVNQHLFDIVDFDSIVARIYVPEKEMGRLRVGQAGRVFASSLGEEARRGEVLRVAPVVDPMSGTVKVTVAIPGNQGLRPGMFVDVELVTAVHEDALLVPKQALIFDNNQVFVFRVAGEGDELTASRMLIEPQLENRSYIEPSPDGPLAVGDRVVVAGQAGLKDGAAVRQAGAARPGGAQAGAAR